MTKATKMPPNKKKKRISKHVRKGRQSKMMVGGDAAKDTYEVGDGNVDSDALKSTAGVQNVPVGESDVSTLARTTKQANKKKLRMKDPEEAATYLNNWKAIKSGNSGIRSPADASCHWKFNKNTQSWLIRHMYECDKVAKGTFSLLLEYLKGLEGTVTKGRIRADATRRARRYKQHCHSETLDLNLSKDPSVDSQNVADVGISVETTRVQDIPNTSKEEMEEEETRWKSLNEHDKKKEYKRARKILDLFLENSPS